MTARESTRVDRLRRVAVATLATMILAGSVWALTVLAAAALDEPLPPCTPTSPSVCAGPVGEHMGDGIGKESPPECVTEDSTRCVWDADERGNGEGRSFVAHADGTVTYIP